MNKDLRQRLAELPKDAGVYFYKDASGEVIYIGKAASLRNRVKQYFQASRVRDPKTDVLVAEIADIDWITVESEIDALFLEAEMVRRYLPRYNILLRDDKSSVYVRISYDSPHPTVTLTRRPMDDGARYFGPYFTATAVKRALKYLRRAFPYSTHIGSVPGRACLLYHLGLCPGLEEGKTSLKDYRANLRKLIAYLKGERVKLLRQIEKEMKTASAKKDFETAAAARNQLFALKNLNRQIIFSDKEFMDISKDEGLYELARLLGLYDEPQPTPGDPDKQAGAVRKLRRIEGYDISHHGGTDTTASMVVFTNGLPHKAEYRKFKMRVPGNDDFAHMSEVIKRRLQHIPRPTHVDAALGATEEPQRAVQDGTVSEHRRSATPRSATSTSRVTGSASKQAGAVRGAWGVPDLILIDGGKGQLGAALKAMGEAGLDIPMIGLAKREEDIILKEADGQFRAVRLPLSSPVVKLLQRIRDESHRFAVSYHSTLKSKRQTASLLDEIPTIGPATRKKLLKTFGSMRGIVIAPPQELEKVIGPKKATLLKKYVQSQKRT